jgi:MOSC domain-containing protein YiiM
VSGRVVSIVYTPADVPDLRPEDRYARVTVDRVRLVEGHGIEGDRKGGRGRRQLNVMAAETLADLAAEGFKTTPGEMGEQLVVAGVDSSRVTVGTRVRIGTAVIEVTLPRTGCSRFEHIQGGKSKRSVTGRLGVMAKVVEDGEVAVGDAVEVLPPPAPPV